ncbi:hypothetical protein BPAE_0114g00020 [Botrytis paeoniae]|uniref:Uncharacterized protein n=1 Tax=Botrytis paeoniae TaxID=278948 RepID=A0A4Z1FKV8_9HELO|nr:hypothetical protein BPAE_0114g00020 [Botrytis paeoniae]
MASQDYPPGFGDEEVQGDGGTDWWEGNQLDGGDGGPGSGNMNGGTDMGNGNNMGVNNNGNNGNNGNGPPPRPQNSNSPPSTTNPPATTSSYDSAISTNTITTSIAAGSSSSSASYISSTSINNNTTSTVDTSSSSSSSFSTLTPTITTTSSNSSTLLAPTTSISSTTTTTSSSTIAATLMSNTGAGTQSVGVTVLPSTTSTQHGLSKGSIAGVTIGSLALLALILTAIWYFLRRKKNKQHRKSIGGFGVAEWNGSGMGGNMTQVNESPSYDGKITAGMGVQRILTWNTMRSLTGTHTRASSSISQTPSTSSTASQSTLQNPFTDQPQLSSFSFPFSPSQQPKTPDQPTSSVTTIEEGPHEDIVDFGDSIDWIRKRDRMRDRERSGLTGPDLGGGMGERKPDWRYSVRVNGGGNNL